MMKFGSNTHLKHWQMRESYLDFRMMDFGTQWILLKIENI